MNEKGLDIRIKKIKVGKRIIRPKGSKKTYIQYEVHLPKNFVEQHKTENLYYVADKVFLMAPDEETVLKILEHLPEMERLLMGKNKNREGEKQ